MAIPSLTQFLNQPPSLDEFLRTRREPLAPVLRKRTIAEEAQAVLPPSPPSFLQRAIADIRQPITQETEEETALRLWEARAAAIRESEKPGFWANVRAGRITPAMGQALRLLGEGTMMGGPSLVAGGAGAEAVSTATGVAGRAVGARVPAVGRFLARNVKPLPEEVPTLFKPSPRRIAIRPEAVPEGVPPVASAGPRSWERGATKTQTGKIPGQIWPAIRERPSTIPQATAQATTQNLAEVAPQLAVQGQAGAVRLPGVTPVGPPLSPSVEQIFAAGNPSLRSRVVQAFRRTEQVFREWRSAPGEELRGAATSPQSSWQKIRDDFRLFKDTPRLDVPRQVARDVVGVAGPLDKPQYDLFNRYIVLRDFAEEATVAAAQGRRPSIPFGVDPQTIRADLQAVEAAVTSNPRIRAAVVRHDRLATAMRDEYVNRGLGTLDDFREHHFRHYVIPYEELKTGGGVMGPRGLGPGVQTPIRPGLRGRTGSTKSIETDYVDVMQKQLTSFYLDNAKDDFILQLKPQVDLLGTLSKAEKQALGRFRPGQIVDLPDGTRTVAWQPREGNILFPTQTVTGRVLNQATTRALTNEELAQLAGQAAQTAPLAPGTREALAMGGPREMWLVDPKIARFLDGFNQGGRQANEMMHQASAAMAMWKRGIVDFLGLPFQVRNAVGDLENGFVIGNLGRSPGFTKYANILIRDAYGGTLTQAEQESLALARQHRVIGSGFTGHLKTPLRARAELAHLEEPAIRFGRAVGKGLETYEKPFRVREDIARFASFMENTERIQSGQMLRTSGAIDIRGLPLERAAGKIAREAFVDYGNKSRAEQQFTQVLAPFISWFYQNARNWANLTVRNPKQIAVKSVPFYGGMFIWNNTGERAKIESALPKWQRMMPHLITGWTLPDGRPLVFTFGSTGATGAAQVVGLTAAFDAAGKVARGDTTIGEALRSLPRAMVTEAGKQIVFAATGPLLTGPAETAMAVTSDFRNLPDIRRGTSRVPQRLEGTASGKRIFLGQQVQAAIPPLGIFMRQFTAAKHVPPDTPLTTRALMGTGVLRPVDTEAEARRRQAVASQEATAGLEDRLYQVEQIYIKTGDTGAVARKVFELKLDPEQVVRRLGSTRVQIDLTRRQMMQEKDPAKARKLRDYLNLLYKQSTFERIKQTPKSVRGEAIPKP